MSGARPRRRTSPTLAGMGSTIEPAELRKFVTHTESKISPKTSANLYGRAEMLAKMPMSVQRWIVAHASGEEYMGFVVDPDR